MNQDRSAAAVLLLDCLGMHGASREVELAERYASEAAFVRLDPQAKVDQLLGAIGLGTVTPPWGVWRYIERVPRHADC
jgi:hypothetical protein